MYLLTRRGFTLIELLIVVALVGILAAITGHHVLRAKAAANETSAIGTLRAIASGQTAFAATCGGGYFSPSLGVLVTGSYLSPSANLSPKSGYTFALTAGSAGATDCGGNVTAVSFYMKAEPISPGQGTRSFASNQTGTVWQSLASVAPAEPFTRIGDVAPIQ